ncbi:FAD-dependent monooxygenase [Halobellus sp. GM3]|uniref:FAD-dependent monooxygenase n=1 Tax=Halobellus sp. GM3 TaxID=3458410 RepID=UPI00403DE6F5
MNVNTIGGGPGGLYASLLLKKTHPDWDVTVYERNPPDVTYGWGIVFPDRTISNLAEADTPSHEAIVDAFERWDPFDIRFDGHAYRCGGNTFASMMRTDLLRVLQDRCREVGVDLRFDTEITDVQSVAGDSDLCLIADGIHSRARDAYAAEFGTEILEGEARFSWFGTEQDFDALTHIFVENDDGIWCAHTYPSPTSTFIIDCDAETWERSGLADASESEYLEYLEDVFAEHLGGHSLLSQQDQWRTFETITNEHWHHENMALLGDAAHTAHYSIGSGTTLAMEDAIGLMNAFEEHETVEDALPAYEAARKPFTENLLSAAERSRIHFEDVRRYYDLPPRQFAVHHLTRSGRLTYGSLKRRDPSFIGGFDEWFAAATPGESTVRSPAYQPVRLGDVVFANRFVRSLDPTYSAVDGVPSSAQRAAFSAAATDEPGLLLTEPLAVAPEARPTAGTPGLYTDEQADVWGDAVASVADEIVAGVRLHHAGPNAAREPKSLRNGGLTARESTWAPRLSSEYPVRPDRFRIQSMTADDRAAVADDFAEAARRSADAGFEYLHLDSGPETHLGACLTQWDGPSAAPRQHALSIVESVADAWPSELPLGVSVPVADRDAAGLSLDVAFDVVDRLAATGCDVVAPVDVTSEDRHVAQKGPSDFSDDIRNETDVPTLATVPTTSVDKVNTLVSTGRADLCVFPREITDGGK